MAMMSKCNKIECDGCMNCYEWEAPAAEKKALTCDWCLEDLDDECEVIDGDTVCPRCAALAKEEEAEELAEERKAA